MEAQQKIITEIFFLVVKIRHTLDFIMHILKTYVVIININTFHLEFKLSKIAEIHFNALYFHGRQYKSQQTVLKKV